MTFSSLAIHFNIRKHFPATAEKNKTPGLGEKNIIINMRKFIYLAKTSIVVELNAPIINNIQQKQEIIITIQKDNSEIVMKLDTDQSRRLIRELEILTAEADKFNKML